METTTNYSFLSRTLSTSYTWNAENRPTAAGGVTYTYDGDGRRVKKSNGTLYWRGLGGEILPETNLSGTNLREFVYFGGARIARREENGTVYYFFSDHLGTARVMTNSTSTVQQESTYYPFGGELRVITNTVDNRYKFTGFERDSESGLDDTLFRKYSPWLARWLSPDPVAGNILNPQSLNRYSYVLNNPCSLTDPLGLQPCPQNPLGAPGWSGVKPGQLRPFITADPTFGPGKRDGGRRDHRGLDLSAHEGVPVYPILPGAVTGVRSQPRGAGNYLTIQSEGGVTHKYFHLSASFVGEGQEVSADTLIGYAGSTGNARPRNLWNDRRGLDPREPHLHIEIWKGNKPLDPSEFLNTPCPQGLNNPKSAAATTSSSSVGGDGGYFADEVIFGPWNPGFPGYYGGFFWLDAFQPTGSSTSTIIGWWPCNGPCT